MTTPAPSISGSAGVNLDGANVQLTAAPGSSGDISCALSCNSQRVNVTFRSDGSDIDVDIPETQSP